MGTENNTLDFIVIGAQKAGTTSLFQHLKQHPEIALPHDKEAQYFSRESIYVRGWSAYFANLVHNNPDFDSAHELGTVTPQYMAGGAVMPGGETASDGHDEHTVPLRIREQLPEVRLIAILRDPVSRALSHHRMLVLRGGERRSFDAAISALLHPDALESARRQPRDATGYVVRGEYGRILAAYYDVFSAEQILVVFTHELERDPAQVLADIQRFIGVTADFQPPNLQTRYRETKTVRGFNWKSPSSWIAPSSPFSPQGMARALARSSAARTAWHALPVDRQRRVMRTYNRRALRARVRNQGKEPNDVSANAKPSRATLARLREHYADDTERLTALLGVTPAWHATASEHADLGTSPLPRQ